MVRFFYFLKTKENKIIFVSILFVITIFSLQNVFAEEETDYNFVFLIWDKFHYSIYSEANLTIGNKTANSNPDEKEVLLVKFYSLENSIKNFTNISLPAIETEENSGIFKVRIKFVGPKIYGDNELVVNRLGNNEFVIDKIGNNELVVNRLGDTVTAEYLGITTKVTIKEESSPPSPGKANLIVIQKVINDNGGNKSESSFPIIVEVNDPEDPFKIDKKKISISGSAIEPHPIDPGPYSVLVSSDSDYEVFFSKNCSGEAVEQETKLCTIIIDDKPSTTKTHLTVIKKFTKDNDGPLSADDFKIKVDNPLFTSKIFSGQSGNGTKIEIGAGETVVTENVVAGYTGDGGVGDCNFTAVLGGSYKCTITNDYNGPPKAYLTVFMDVNDHCVTKSSSDFKIRVTATNPYEYIFPGSADGEPVIMDPGNYTVSEISDSGYEVSKSDACSGEAKEGEIIFCRITCNDFFTPPDKAFLTLINSDGNEKQQKDFAFIVNGNSAPLGEKKLYDANTDLKIDEVQNTGYLFNSITGDKKCPEKLDTAFQLSPGDDVTCKITYSDGKVSLTLVKEFDFKNGATVTESEFRLFADGPSSFNGTAPSVSSDDEVENFKVGTYTLSEEGPAGHTGNGWNCVGDGDQSGDTITLDSGETATCTIVNSDDSPGLTLVKELDFNNGATASESDFTLFANGPSSFSGAGPSVSSDDEFIAGTYTLSETGPEGYTGGDWVCVGGVQDGNSISLVVGDSATCTITNTDDEPSLTLVKEVVNDNGATASESDFTLFANGPSSFSGAGPSVSSDDEVENFKVGTYTLSEEGPEEYVTSGWACEGGVQSGSYITLDVGESATCTITNSEVALLTLIRSTIFLGYPTATYEFPLTVKDTSVNGEPVSSENKTSVKANTDLIIGKPQLVGYSFDSIIGDEKCPKLLDTTFQLKPGDDVTCIIVNNDPFWLIYLILVGCGGGIIGYILKPTPPKSPTSEPKPEPKPEPPENVDIGIEIKADLE